MYKFVSVHKNTHKIQLSSLVILLKLKEIKLKYKNEQRQNVRIVGFIGIFRLFKWKSIKGVFMVNN